MSQYWIRNKKGQVAAEIGEAGLAVHDQGLSWQLEKRKEEGEPPFSRAGDGRSWDLAALLSYLEENGYTPERLEADGLRPAA